MSPSLPRASGSRLGHSRTSSDATRSSPSAPTVAGEANKSESFSYVSEPTLRFVVDLAPRPELDSEDDRQSPASAPALAPVSAAPPHLASAPTTATASFGSSASASTATHTAGEAKRKRRMSLGALLHHKKSAHSDSSSTPTGAVRSQQAQPQSIRPSVASAQTAAGGMGGSTRATDSPSASSPNDDGPLSMSPAQSFAHSYGERISQGSDYFPSRARTSTDSGAVEPPASSSNRGASPPLQPGSAVRSSFDSDGRPSLTEAEALSGSSQDSLAGAPCPSVTSTAPTSPGSHLREREDSLDSNETELGQQEEGKPSAVMKFSETANATALGLGQSRLGPANSTSPPSYTSPATSTDQSSGSEQGRLSYSRSITRNIEQLSLSALQPRASSSSTSNVSPGTNGLAASQRSDASATTGAASQPSLRGLPRLLSTSAIPHSRGPADEEEQEQEQDESEAETETDEQSDEEGETYATSDEGPVTSRSPAGTPGLFGQAPPLATPRANFFSGSSPSRPSPSLRSARLPSFNRLSDAAAGPSSWVAFSGQTPTPGPMRSSRPTAAQGATSYFDMPRANGSSSAKTPMSIPTTPLAPMSMSDVARGKRPAMSREPTTSATVRTPGPAASTTPARTPAAAVPVAQSKEASPDAGMRAGLYRLRSQSVIALASPSMVDDDDQPVGTAALTGLDPIWQSGVPTKQRTPAPAFLSFSLDQPQPPLPPASSAAPSTFVSSIKTPAALNMPNGPVPASPATPDSPSRSRAHGIATAGGFRLQRTRSMYELRVPPPPYQNAYGRPGQPAQIVEAREEEGKEGLPSYTCAIHIEGYMPRKMEFTAPGVQARDRTWRRQYFVLHGTSIKIYKYNLRTHPIPGEEDWSIVPVDIAGSDGPPPLHFHEGEYGIVRETANHRFPLSIDEVKAKAKDRIVSSATGSAQNALVRHYSLQNAESGLAADYIKRKHVVRVRAEGEQFLLQAKDDRGVIDLIEALQAATNVALDLDARPLPKFITLPRRRRRRRRPVEGDAAAAAAAGAGGAANGSATAGAARDESTAASASAGDRMGDMLAEEQNAYAQRASGTVM
ncbi:hypothetical protein JCM10908_000547 [Rhodotorula pacifica]|uniref:uncharacterized protein n=1 Tax=Rhodotorula pacifica TaxID=1495444 RepID=UPI00316C9BE8